MRRPIALWTLFVVAAGVACALRPLKAVDFHAYHAAARSFFLFSGPMYGPNQEFGWPMLYRYPPLFLCLFRPLASIPLNVAAGIWAALKVLFLGPLVWTWYRRYPPSRFGPALGISALLLLPYLLYDLQVGNVQIFLVEMVCLALLLCDEHPVASSLLLGLAAAIKVWPAFVLPFLAARGHRRWCIGLQSVTAAGIFTLVPGFWLGWANFSGLLKQWFLQEQRINALLGDRWYPSQSLRGVMLRYFTRMDYSGLPDQNYRQVNLVSLPSWEVRQFWLVLAIVLGVLALVWVYRCASDGAAYSIFFCSLLIIQPNVRGSIYVALLWPVLYAGVVLTDPQAPRLARWGLMVAAGVAVLEPLVPGAASQRLMQVLGIDFIGVLVPLTFAHLVYSSRGMLNPLMRTTHLLLLPIALAALTLAGVALAQQSPDPQPQPGPQGEEASAPQTGPAPSAASSQASNESHERILGVIPAFGVTNRQHAPTLTPREKFKLFVRQAFDPFQWVAAGAQAGLSQADNRMPGYGQGAAGYGKRYGASMADVTGHEFISNFMFPVMFRQDPRYFRLGQGTILHRIIYSLEQEFWAKTDQGTRQFNYSKVLGAFAAKAVSNAYYPPADRGFGLTMSRSGLSILSGLGSALGAEFWPDIDCKLFHKCRGM